MDLRKQENINYDYIPVKTKQGTYKVFTKDILLIEKDLRRVRIYTHKHNYCFYSKMDYVFPFLGKNFHKCHSSCIINLDKVTKMEDGVIHLEGDKWVMLGQRSYQNTRKSYGQYLYKNL
ncbi:MAG: LytR/AlgR family response regulator transcription factor [Anaerovoracaceae bacterium]|jgi:DNA-binding LytR/AlgR family response regulator